MLNKSVANLSGIKCPNCGTSNVRRAHRRGVYERLISLANIYPYKCVQCPDDIRFHYRTR